MSENEEIIPSDLEPSEEQLAEEVAEEEEEDEESAPSAEEVIS